MALFQSSVIQKELQNLNQTVIDEKWNEFIAHFGNVEIQQKIRGLKEEQYQGEFLDDLFVKVLGYTKPPKPNHNLVTEQKNETNSKKADGAIIVDEKVIGVIELKGTNTTDLEKVKEQAFLYKVSHPECIYVITSNFEKLRFYIENTVDFIEFNLFQLTKKEFSLLYICLSYENIKNNVPKHLKDESVSKESKITKQLYKDYSDFKQVLFNNLVELNPQYDKLLLFKKTQKLLDRFLFIFFAEDRQLVPTNLIRRINLEWEDIVKVKRLHVSLYDRYKTYFDDLNAGATVTLPAFGKKTGDAITAQFEIFAYNGGLFMPDEVLDNVKIDDALLHKHSILLSDYDFESDVDVNILGHIFENSLNEIDEIKSEIEGQVIDKTKTKRKKDGVFYTPKYITKYIVDNTVGKLCAEKKNELKLNEEEYHTEKNIQTKTKKALLDKLAEYRNWLLNITICDPACGSGAFLNQALEFLITEHRYIDELQAKLMGDSMILSDVEASILENNLFGVDLNDESVEIAKLSLWLRTAQRGRKLTSLNNNIKCGNSLIDDPEVAGDKAFNWHKEFPTVFKEKNKFPFHITTSIHDSRTSERMIQYKARERRFDGTKPDPEVFPMTKEEEELIASTVADIAKEDNLNIAAFNLCWDHMHILLVCEEDEVPKIIQKIKAKTGRAVNIFRGKTIVADNCTKEADDCTKGAGSLDERNSLDEGSNNRSFDTPRGEKQNSFWTQKYHCKPITSDDQFWNTYNYIEKNKVKHDLPKNPKLENIILGFVKTYEDCFKPEYTGGFDVIIGNPPYGVNFNEVEKKYLSNFDKSVPDYEIYIYFISLYKKILKINSVLSYIFPNTFLSTVFGKKYRDELLSTISVYQIVDLSNDNTFVDASVRTCIFSFRNKENEFAAEFIKLNNESFVQFNKYTKTELLLNSENLMSLFNQTNNEIEIINKIKGNNILSKFHEVSQGLIPYDKYRGHDEQTIKNRIWHSTYQKDKTFKKELKGGDVNRFNIKWNGELWISYGEWLAAPRKPEFFRNERILVREILADKLYCGYTNEEYYNTPSCINIINFKKILDLRFTLCVLNSKLIGWYCKKVSPKANKGLFPKILVNDVRNIPLIEIDKNAQNIFAGKADAMLQLNKDLQEQTQKFISLLKSDFQFEKPSKKIEDFYLLDWSDFNKELQKNKIVLVGEIRDDWHVRFERYKKQALELKSQIDQTDKEIDRMVYELYGLTEEEIHIVENS